MSTVNGRRWWDGPIVIRPSALDGYRFMMADGGEYEWPIDRVVARLRAEPGEDETDETRFGTRVHKCFETGDFEFLEVMNVHGLEIEVFQPDIVEWRHKRSYEVDGREVILSGKVDAIAGTRIIDYKTINRAIDLSRYHDAVQWRAYLAIHQRCDRFRYEVLQFGRTRAKRGQPSQKFLAAHRFLELHRYDGLEDDVYAALVQYYRFLVECENAGLLMLGPKADGSFGVMTPTEEQAWTTS